MSMVTGGVVVVVLVGATVASSSVSPLCREDGELLVIESR